MLLEERNDPLSEVLHAAHPIAHAVTVVASYYPTPKECFECIEELHVAFMLHHGKFRQYLKTGGHLLMRLDADEEATFSIDEAADPLRRQPLGRGRT